MVGIRFFWDDLFFPCMTFTKGSQPPVTLLMNIFVYIRLGGAGPKEESGQPNPVTLSQNEDQDLK